MSPPMLVKFKNFDGADIYINVSAILCVIASSTKGNTIIYVRDGSEEYYEVQCELEEVIRMLTQHQM